MENSSSRISDQIGALRRYAHSLASSPQDAEDLVQDALVQAYEQRHSLRTSSSLRGWLMAILHNTFISEWRRRQHSFRQAVSLDEIHDVSMPATQEHVVRLKQIHQAFDRLSDDQRAVMHLVAVEGLPYQDAADILNVPIGTLMSRLGRARAVLRQFENEVATLVNQTPSARRSRLKIVGGVDEQA